MKGRPVAHLQEFHEKRLEWRIFQALAQLDLEVGERGVFFQRVQRIPRQVNHAAIIIVGVFTDRPDEQRAMQGHIEHFQTLIPQGVFPQFDRAGTVLYRFQHLVNRLADVFSHQRNMPIHLKTTSHMGNALVAHVA